MRNNKAKDLWKSLEKTNASNNYCSSICLKGLHGFEEDIEIEKKLQVFCGLNGAGKSTILAAIKSVFGIGVTELDESKLENASITGKIVFQGESYDCCNKNGSRLVDLVTDCDEVIHFYDYFSILNIINYLCNENNLDEQLEQNENILLEEKDVQSINYLVGKNYSSIELCTIDDVDDFDSIPFFVVNDNETQYDSRRMGTGEYALLYFFWMIRYKKDSIIVIEEPESFISVNSQIRLMDLMVENIIHKKNSFILSTHSPYILQDVKEKYIKILISVTGGSEVQVPTRNNVMEHLGMKMKHEGVIFVEDEMAKCFLETLLRKEKISINGEYDIKIAYNGSSGITTILNQGDLSELNFSIIGIYDEDQKEKVSKELKKKCTFLPPKKDVENAMYELMNTKKYQQELCEKLEINPSELTRFITELAGMDRHDWFTGMSKKLRMTKSVLLDKLYDTWVKEHKDEIGVFKTDLNRITTSGVRHV